MDEEVEDVTRLLPDDALAVVLTLLEPRGLVACRHICKAWRAVVDTHRLLRMDLLPLSLTLGVRYYRTDRFGTSVPG
jgi:hypothetical protein